jgi:amidohydrolase
MTNTDSVIALRHTLHAHAERSNQETKTRAIIKDFLKTQTDTRIEDRGSWLYAVHEEEGAKETLVFRADHDAIVNSHGTVYHGCGHDGHTAMLAGCAQALSGQRLGKNIVYLFQPAEENGTGAALCTPLFSEYRVDAVYGLHNMPGVEKNLLLARPGTMQYASEGLTLDFLGKQSHASQPENGINPAFAVAKLMLALQPFHKSRHNRSRWAI